MIFLLRCKACGVLLGQAEGVSNLELDCKCGRLNIYTNHGRNLKVALGLIKDPQDLAAEEHIDEIAKLMRSNRYVDPRKCR